MKTLELNKMENVIGGGCAGFIGGMIGVGLGVATAEIGVGIAVAAAGLLDMANNAGECEEQLSGTWFGNVISGN